MTSSYENSEKKTSKEKTEPSQGYFVLIPSHILNNPHIDDSTAILFGRIASLSNTLGYCYATDKYLAELTCTSDRQLRRRLQKLEKHGYIKRETEKKGMYWDRKLIPNFNYEKPPTPERTDTDVRTERNCMSVKQYKYKQYKNTTTEPEGTRSSDQPDKKEKVVVVFDCLKKLKLPDKTRKRLSRKFSEQHLNLAVERTLRWTGRRNDEAALMTVLSRMDEWNDDSDETRKQENQALLKEIRHLDGKTIKNITVIIGNNYAEFSQGSTSCYTMIEDDDFEENISKYLNLFKEPL